VKPGTLLYNKGVSAIKFRAGADLSGKVKSTFKYVGPGSAMLIPAQWTVIEVTNENTTDIAIISVRKF
jgi:hypothetical protein